MSVHHSGVLVHQTGRERALSQEGGGKLVIGDGEVIGAIAGEVSNFGSIHQWSIYQDATRIFGYDHRRGAVWVLGEEGLSSVSEGMKFSAKLESIQAAIGEYSDVTSDIPDNPVMGNGILVYPERKFNELHWTFHRLGERPFHKTLAIDTRRMVYTGERSYSPRSASVLGIDLYTADVADMPQFWMHGSNDVGRTTFYGQLMECLASWIVSKGGYEPNVYDALHLFCSPIPAVEHRQVTDYQETSSPFITGRVYADPKYKESAWRLPYLRAAVAAAGQDLSVGSPLRGRWLISEFRWKTDKELIVTLAETIFRRSHA